MSATFFQWRSAIQLVITHELKTYKKKFSQFVLDDKQFDHLIQISTKGKLFRGCLLTSFYQSLGGKEFSDPAIKLAAAIELYGTAILIHDDIIDRSDFRRGALTTYKYFEHDAAVTGLNDPAQFGLSAGINIGDFLLFLSQSIICSLELPHHLILEISKITAQELLLLGLAQVEDSRLTFTSDVITEDEIIKMYVGKTGTYTGRWPLMLAGVLAGLSPKVIQQIGRVGEAIGVLFQLKDDELGIFGDQEITGKSTTGDIVEGKKTLYYLLLQKNLRGSEKEKVFAIIGNAKATSEDVEWVKSIIRNTGIYDSVKEKMHHQRLNIEAEISQLPVSDVAKNLLLQVTAIISERNK